MNRIRPNTLWLKLTWGLAGKTFTDVGAPCQFVGGVYRGTRIALFSYNDEADAGFVDIDHRHYPYAR